MNRPIKFRAWDYQDEKMITSYDDLTTSMHGTEPMPLIPLTGGVVIPYWEKRKMDGQSHYELMQFTGLHDKNGVEIYEGDIVNLKKWFLDKNLDNDKKETGVIRWWGAEYILRFGDGEQERVPISEQDTFEVIGNVFENPELLTQTEPENE